MSKTLLAHELHMEVAGKRTVRIHEGVSPGENGVTVGRAGLHGKAHLRLTSPDHWLVFSLGGGIGIDCRIADRRRVHMLRPGSMALLPADSDAIAETGGPVEQLVLRISSRRIAVGGAERGCLAAGLVECLCGRDEALMRFAMSLYAEARADYVNGPLFWNEAADRIVDHLIEHHLTRRPAAFGGSLSTETITRLTDFIRSNIDRPLDVAVLAAVAGVSRYHFTRLFTRSVCMTPHRYVMKLRIDTATHLVRMRRLQFAKIALATGFADQSHLSRWVKRVHGTTLARIAA